MPTKIEKSLKEKKSSRGSAAKRGKSEELVKTRSVRLDMRINIQTKSLIERAAALTGQTLTDFAISNLVQVAVDTIEQHQRLEMSDRARDQFLAALNRPAKTLPALARAARLHALATKGE